MEYTMLIFQEASGKRLWGVFPELDSVSSFGDTLKEARKNTIEAATLWLEDKEPPEELGHSQVLAFASQAPSELFRGISKVRF